MNHTEFTATAVSAIDALQTAAYRCYQDLHTRPIDIFLVGRNLDLVANEIAAWVLPAGGATLEPPLCEA